MFRSEHYRIRDIWKRLKGTQHLVKHFRNDILTINFMEQVRKVDIPIYSLQGEYDYVTPTSLVKEHVEMVESPDKELFIFEKAAQTVTLYQYCFLYSYKSILDAINDVLLDPYF